MALAVIVMMAVLTACGAVSPAASAEPSAAASTAGISMPAAAEADSSDAEYEAAPETSASTETAPGYAWDETVQPIQGSADAASGEAAPETTEIALSFGDTVMTATLDNSEISRAFIERLPMTITMNRYADREYYAAIEALPENGEAIDDYENGDVTYYTAGKSLAIFFDNAQSSSQGNLIRMGRITSDLSLFDSIGENAEVTIALLESEAEMTDFDFSVFTNVEITGLDLSTLNEEELSVLYQQARYCQAMTDAYTKTMAEIVPADRMFTHMSGLRQTREEYFADVESGSLRYFTIGIENPVVEVNGNYASVTFTSVLNANAYGARGTYGGAEIALTSLEHRTESEDAPAVYYLSDITPEAMVQIYNALQWTPTGNVAVKLSTGEPPASNYLQPALIADLVRLVEGTIVECNTAYGGSRASTAMHYQVAEDHGFTAIAPVQIQDENGPMTLPVNGGTVLSENYVGAAFADYDSYLVLSHFKGHAMAGFGGAIKNISIGLGSSEGKNWIHTGGTSRTSFMGGAQDAFCEAMGDAGKSVSDYLGNGERIVYINVMNRLSIDCDCNGNPAQPDMHDIGILASADPVALDQACIDLVYAAPDHESLVNRIESRNGIHTLENAEAIGLGRRDYHLVNLDA